MNGRLIDYLTIVPDANVRIFDLDYQIMLYELFHRRRLTRTTHLVVTPLTLCGVFAVAASEPFGALAMMVVLFVWYLKLDVVVGLTAVPILGVLWLAAERLHRLSPETAGWWGLAIAGGGALLEVLSHAHEPFPPPWTGSDGFLPNGIRAAVPRRVMLCALLAALTIFPVLEFVSSPRIFAVLLARGLARFGHRRDRCEDATATALEILAGERVLAEQFPRPPSAVA